MSTSQEKNITIWVNEDGKTWSCTEPKKFELTFKQYEELKEGGNYPRLCSWYNDEIEIYYCDVEGHEDIELTGNDEDGWECPECDSDEDEKNVEIATKCKKCDVCVELDSRTEESLCK